MKPRFKCIVAFLVMFIICYSSSAQIKIKAESHKKVTDTKHIREVDDLIKLSEQCINKNPNEALRYGQRAVVLSKDAGYLKGEGYAMQQRGRAFLKLSQYIAAQENLMIAQKILIQINDDEGIAIGYNLIGESYEKRGVQDSARIYFSKAMKLAKKIENNAVIARAYYNTGMNSFYAGDYRKALSDFEKGENLSLQMDNKSSLASMLEGKGHTYRAQAKFDEALDEFKKAMQLYKALNNMGKVGKCYSGMAQSYSLKGEYDTAMQLNLASLRIMERLPAKDDVVQILNSIGIIHFRRGDYKSSLNYFNRSLKLSREIKNIRNIASLHVNIGTIYNALGKYDSALIIYQEGLKMVRNMEMKEFFTSFYINIALAHFQRNAYDSCLYFSKRALSIAEEMGNKTEIIDAYNTIGEALFKMRNFSDGISYCNRAILIEKEIGSKNQLKDTYKLLSAAFSSTQNFQQALTYDQMHDSIENIIFSEKKNKDMADVEAKYESEKKDKILAQNGLMLNEQRLILAQHQVFIAVLTSCILLLVMIGFFLRLKQKKRQIAIKMEYDRKHLKIEQQLELARLKSNVFTNISHEFRTPLTLFLTPLEQMMKEAESEQLKQRYEMMQRNANQLLDMVNQLLELSKIESGHDHLQVARYNLIDFIREILHYFTPLKEKNCINIVLLNELELPYLYFDRDKLEKVFYNLLSNAFKYSNKGGVITLFLKNRNDHNHADFPEGFVEITVKDCGKGIAREHIPYIFNRFYQVDTHVENGSGIGLALVKEIVEMHAGSVEVKSEPGSGTEFILSLPAGCAHFHEEELLQPTDSIPHESMNGNFSSVGTWTDTDQNFSVRIVPDKSTVLIVEDNVEVNKYISELFLVSYNVIHASNGQKGFGLAMQHSPDLIICDVMMPGMDGYAFTAQLKNNLATSHIPIILLTAKADRKHKLEGLDAGADDYMTKPFHVDELLIRSENLIVQRKKLRNLFSKASFAGTSTLVPSGPDHEFLLKATDIVLGHIDDPEFDVEKFCKEIAMSYTVLHKKLKAITGQHVTRFIRCIRLKKAVELIERDAGTMSDIASWVGFNNRQFFIRSFREQYGMTPTEYKITLRKKPVGSS